MSILSGYRVLDCSIAMAGPFAAQRLGDLGADVIKIEPLAGEWQRHVSAGGARGNRVNVSFLSLNRNKRSLAIDLKNPEGRAILLDLVRSADVFPAKLPARRRRTAWRRLRDACAPSIRASSTCRCRATARPVLTAIGPGQDLLLQAMSGAMLSSGRAGDPPLPAGQYLVDAVTAYTAFEGALAALLHRERTGEGQLVKVNMLDAIVTMQMQELPVFTVGGLAATPHRRAACPRLYSRAVRRVCHQGQVHRAGVSAA